MDRLPHHIVEAASQLDERACAELLSRCEGLVRAAIRQGGYYCVADGDEEDLRAELRYQILRSLPRWEPEKGPFSTWVYGIARNVMNGYVRARRREPPLVSIELVSASFPQVGDPAAYTDEEEPLSNVLVALRASIKSMSPEDQLVAEHLMRDEPRRWLAFDMGISVDAAKMRVSRMRHRLRGSLTLQWVPDDATVIATVAKTAKVEP